MTLFARTYRAPQLYRIWDMFFCEGVKVLFRLALVIIREALEFGPADVVLRAYRCDNPMDIVVLIKETANQLSFDILLNKMDRLPLTDLDLAQACKQAREELQSEARPTRANINRRK